MKTKTFLLTSLLFVFLLIGSTGIHAQTANASLDQLKLMEQELGNWQANTGKDTIEVWETQQYGKTFITTVSRLVKGTKSPLYISNVSFNLDQDKIQGFILWYNGGSSSWEGSWKSDKKLTVEIFDSFKPSSVWGKGEIVFETPANMTFTMFNPDGIKTLDLKFKKVK